MASSALAGYLIFGRAIREGTGKIRVMTFSFTAGAFSVIMGACMAGVMLWLSDSNFAGAVKLLIAAHVPLALIEGAVTSFLVMWLKKSAPEFLS